MRALLIFGKKHMPQTSSLLIRNISQIVGT
jgi:hypothetical protein